MTQKNKKKLIKTGVIFGIWIFLIFGIGSMLGNKTTAENPKQIASTQNKGGNTSTKEDTNPEGESSSSSSSSSIYGEDASIPKTKSEQAKEDKLQQLTQKTTRGDVSNLERVLNLDTWEVVGEIHKNGVSILKPYFPSGQNQNGWREAFVLRTFPNVKLQNPVPVVYEIYDTWLKIQLPDLRINPKEDATGISFSGYSDKGRVFISGKIFMGSIDNVVYIAQYTIKNDNQPDVDKKAQQWSINLERIK